ncbi:MAG: hypothetical protein ABIB43_05295 [archaeon]
MKKGEIAFEYIVLMIVIMIALFIVFMFITRWKDGIEKENEGLECIGQVQSHVKMLELTNGEKVLPIKCKIKNETIKKDEDIKRAIAERMESCWNDWLKGEEELFGDEKWTYCHPCYILDFEEDVVVKDFEQYLMSTNVPNKDYTYMESFTGTSNNADFSFEKMAENPALSQVTTEFRTDTKKVILFYYTKDKNNVQELIDEAESTLKGATRGALAGELTGAIAGGIIFGAGGGILCGLTTLGTGTVACAAVGVKWGVIIGGGVGTFAGAYLGNTFADKYPLWMSFILFREYNAEELKSLDCDISPARQD